MYAPLPLCALLTPTDKTLENHIREKRWVTTLTVTVTLILTERQGKTQTVQQSQK